MSRLVYGLYGVLSLGLLACCILVPWVRHVQGLPVWIDNLPVGIAAGAGTSTVGFVSWLRVKRSLSNAARSHLLKPVVPTMLALAVIGVDVVLAVRIGQIQQVTILCDPGDVVLVLKNRDAKVTCGSRSYIAPGTELVAIAEGYKRFESSDILRHGELNGELLIRLEAREEWTCTMRQLRSWDPVAADQVYLTEVIGAAPAAGEWIQCQQYVLGLIGRRTNGKAPQGAGSTLLVSTQRHDVGVRLFSDDLTRCEPAIPNPHESKPREKHKLMVHDECSAEENGQTEIVGARLEVCATQRAEVLTGLTVAIKPSGRDNAINMKCTEVMQ